MKKFLFFFLISSPLVAGEINQELSHKSEWGYTNVDGLIPADDFPQYAGTFSYNLRAKGGLFSDFSFSSDVGLLWLTLDNFDGEKDGKRVDLEKNASEKQKGKIALNELYLAFNPTAAWSLQAGRRRVIWGSGYFRNPTDIMNPGKNILDPNQVRKGSMMTSLDYRTENSTLSLLLSAQIKEKDNGLTEKIYVLNGEDRTIHAARYWMMISDFDASVMYFKDTQFNQLNVTSDYAGFSFSGMVSPSVEMHGEAMKRIPSTGLEYLFGGSYTFSDESVMTIEILRNDEGLDKNQFEIFSNSLLITKKNQKTIGSSRFSSGQLLMQDHIALGYSWSSDNQDLRFSLNNLFNPVHRAVIASPSLTWDISQSLSLTTSVALSRTFAGQILADNSIVSEQDLFPVPYRGSIEIKTFF